MSEKDVLARLTEAEEWMRRPDWAETFSIADLVRWVNDRPTAALREASARITADAARIAADAVKIRDLEVSLRAFGASQVRDRVAARVGCNADILQDALQDEVRAAFTPTQEPTR